MYIKKLEMMTVESTVPTVNREERYELIAMIAQRFNASKHADANENVAAWDSNEIELNFEEAVYRYN